MILLSAYCFDCDSWWIFATAAPPVHRCVFCGSGDVTHRDYQRVEDAEARAA